MLAPLFVIPVAILNRTARGEGKWKKWQWHLFMNATIAIIFQDLTMSLIWAYIIALFAVPPTHSMFSAIHGQPPGREDSKLWYWLQYLAVKINNILPSVDNVSYWKRFGIIQGGLRGALVLPGYVALYLTTENPWAILGLLHLAHGGVYYWWKSKIDIADIVVGMYLGVMFCLF